MGRMYTVVFSAVAVTAAQDLFSLAAADDKPIAIAGWQIGQHTDEGDAQAEMLQIRVRRGQTVVGSGGSTPTAQPVDPHDVAAGFTPHANDTTIANTGTIVVLVSDAFNAQVGDKVMLPEQQWLKTDQGSGIITLELVEAPADSLTMDGTIWVWES